MIVEERSILFESDSINTMNPKAEVFGISREIITNAAADVSGSEIIAVGKAKHADVFRKSWIEGT